MYWNGEVTPKWDFKISFNNNIRCIEILKYEGFTQEQAGLITT